jgi:hypothetical protein
MTVHWRGEGVGIGSKRTSGAQATEAGNGASVQTSACTIRQ